MTETMFDSPTAPTVGAGTTFSQMASAPSAEASDRTGSAASNAGENNSPAQAGAAAAEARDAAAASVIATTDDVIEALKDVVDPELMINIIDLGLVYGVEIGEHGDVTIEMTLTTPMCPLTDQLEYDIRVILEGIATSVTITWVWLPPWTLDRISDDGRAQLRALGYNL